MKEEFIDPDSFENKENQEPKKPKSITSNSLRPGMQAVENNESVLDAINQSIIEKKTNKNNGDNKPE